jgi:peptidyl-prolyl cis-trans isomerase C
MNSSVGFGIAGAACIGAAIILAFSNSASGDTVMTVNGVDIDSSVLELYIESRMQRPAEQVSPEERASMLEELQDIYLLTTQPRADELSNEAAVAAQIELQKRGILAQVVATDFIEKNQASDEEILAEYAKQIEAAPAQQFKARHILVEEESSAIDLIGQLDEGADFQELARENSTGPSGPNGGDLGWFSPNQMVRPFSDAVAELGDGEYTKAPVQTQFGWHVILREDSRDAEPPTLDSVRDVIKQRLEQEQLQNYLESLRGQLDG